MSSTPQRRSTRTTKEPERLAASNAPLTPRKRGKAAASAFATPVGETEKGRRGKRQKVGASKRSTAATNSDGDGSDRESAGEEAVSSHPASEEDSDDGEEDLSEFEERKRTASTRTPRKSQKKAPVAKARQTAAGQQRLKRQKKTAVRAPDNHGDGDVEEDASSQLFAAVVDDKAAVAQVVGDWVGEYRENADAAVCELVNFLIRLAGSRRKIKEDSVYAEDVGEVVEEIQAQTIAALKRGDQGADNDGDDILVGKTKEHRRMRKQVQQFLARLITDGQHRLVFDQVNEENKLSPFMEVVLQWLVGMAGASYRPFRHVATVVTLAVQSAFVGIRARISGELQTAQRQLEAELKRETRRAPAAARSTQLRTRVAQLAEQDEVAEAGFRAFYDTVFIFRYRDVDAGIRSECVGPLATWCRTFPASYLDTEYLRYLGWALNDKDARVREAAVAAIGGPLVSGKQASHGTGSGPSGSDEGVAEGLRPFIARFLPRIVQVAAGDIDGKVQVAALRLVAQLGKHQFLDPAAKIGDIRRIRPGSGGGGSGSKGARAKKRTRGTYGHSLSQQLLE
ncbi:cohesin complex subunit, partial [Coemansia thaxteri]